MAAQQTTGLDRDTAIQLFRINTVIYETVGKLTELERRLEKITESIAPRASLPDEGYDRFWEDFIAEAEADDRDA